MPATPRPSTTSGAAGQWPAACNSAGICGTPGRRVHAGRNRAKRPRNCTASARIRVPCTRLSAARPGRAALWRNSADSSGTGEEILLLGEQADPALQQQVAPICSTSPSWEHTFAFRFAPAGRLARPARRPLPSCPERNSPFGPSRVLYQEQHRVHALALGRAGLAAEAERRAAALTPGGAREHAALGRTYFLAGEFRRAADELDRALALQPGALWPTFYRGCCACRLGQYEDAVAAFSVCLVLAPDRAWCSCNRGLAYLGLGRPDRALPDLDRALRQDPACAAAALARGTLHHAAGRHQQALADLEGAERSGLDTAALHYNLALVHLALGHRDDARSRAAPALRRDPSHRQAHLLFRQLRDPTVRPPL